MALAWTCPTHGTFRQTALDEIATIAPSLARGVSGSPRYACPQCAAQGRDAFLKPATTREIAAMQQRERSNAAQAA